MNRQLLVQPLTTHLMGYVLGPLSEADGHYGCLIGVILRLGI